MSQDDSALIPVPFHGATLTLIDRDGTPYVALRPIVEAMGLSWASQTVKLNADKTRWGVSMIETPADPQPMLCLPLCKIGGWLMTIHANKVRPDLRDTIRAYQAECDDALWSYWTQRATAQPTYPPLPTKAPSVAEVQMRALVTLRNGILVGIEPLPAALPCPRYHYPAETAKPHRPNGDARINAYALLEQSGSPLGALLRQMKTDGHDVDGALIQYHALRGLLTYTSSTWEDLRRKSLDMLDACLSWSPDLPGKLWNLKDW